MQANQAAKYYSDQKHATISHKQLELDDLQKQLNEEDGEVEETRIKLYKKQNTIEESEVQDDSDYEARKNSLKENIETIKSNGHSSTSYRGVQNSNLAENDTEGESVLIGDEEILSNQYQNSQANSNS